MTIKNFKMIIMAVAAIMTMGTLNSCGSDNDDSTGGEAQVTNVSGKIYNFFILSEYTLDAYDVKIEYNGIDGKTSSYDIEKNLLDADTAKKLGITYWYDKQVEGGSKVYYSTLSEDLKVPANVTFSYSPTFAFKGDKAVTHTTSVGKDGVFMSYDFISILEVTKSDGTKVPFTIGDNNHNAATGAENGKDFGERYSVKKEHSVSLTATDQSWK